MAEKQAPPVDPSISRVCIYREFDREPGPCPRCRGVLHQQRQHYVVTTHRGRRVTDTFMMSGDFGWYCEDCLTVVINPAQVAEMLRFSDPSGETGSALAVLGLVDLSLVPKEKRHLPLGNDDNPIPLIEFAKTPGRSQTRPTRRRESKRRKRKRRR